ncbi:MAG: LacI family DNA-binding transcriptional regulator [Rubrivivax sp.]|jgi:LacI family gluconate utilization system Gnt-I transcriptional repressor|nr:LacI family DNA-binding transcriptional regulator [Rubrivivax sp.]
METYPQPPLPPPARKLRRKHGGATLREVAEVAEVTAITVSRYLREPQRVAPLTAERIRLALAETGYVPHKQAGMLASGQGTVVAVLLPNLANSIFAETAQGLAETLQPAGFELLMTSTSYSLEREEEQLRAVLGWRPAAVIVTGRRHSPGSLALLASARRSGTPVVEIWDCPGDTGNPARKTTSTARFVQVGLDHRAIGRAMAQHLLDSGHRHLAYVDSGVAEDYRAHERGQAFALAARQAGAQVAPLTARPGDPFDAGRLALATLLDTAGPHAVVTAAAFANDHLASGALLEAVQRGVPVPQRMALLGFGDFAWSRQLRPTLSSVWLPRIDIGQIAAQAVLTMLQNPQAPVPRAAPLGFALRIRESTQDDPDPAAPSLG